MRTITIVHPADLSADVGAKREQMMKTLGYMRDFLAVTGLFGTFCGWYVFGSALIG